MFMDPMPFNLNDKWNLLLYYKSNSNMYNIRRNSISQQENPYSMSQAMKLFLKVSQNKMRIFGVHLLMKTRSTYLTSDKNMASTNFFYIEFF
jgi:hypothetical protein